MNERVTEREFLEELLTDIEREQARREIEFVLNQQDEKEIAKDIINSYRGWRNVMNQWKRDKPWSLDRYMNYHTSKRFNDSPEPYNLESWKQEIKKAKEILKVKK